MFLKFQVWSCEIMVMIKYSFIRMAQTTVKTQALTSWGQDRDHECCQGNPRQQWRASESEGCFQEDAQIKLICTHPSILLSSQKKHSPSEVPLLLRNFKVRCTQYLLWSTLQLSIFKEETAVSKRINSNHLDSWPIVGGSFQALNSHVFNRLSC